MARPQRSWGLADPETPSSPRTMRTLRKIQSHQVLTTSNALIAQTQSSRPPGAHTGAPEPGAAAASAGPPKRSQSHRRPRSNSDAAAREAALAAAAPTQRRPARKTGSGVGVKRSLLETLLRDGPHNGKTREALQELKYLVLSTRVDADGDGMVRASPKCCHRQYRTQETDSYLITVPVPCLPMVGPSQCSACPHRRLPRPCAPGRLPSVYQDSQRYLPHARNRPALQAPRNRGESHPASQCRGLETSRHQSETSIATYFI